MKKKEKPAVLIVDDDKNTRDGLERAFRRNYNIYVAENGERALAILNDTDIDVMLSDVRMPGMDGVTLMQRAMARHPRLVSILLTAYGNVEGAVEAMKRGAYDFLMKPVNLDHLDMVIKRALRSCKMETENINLHEQLDDKYGMESIIGNSSPMQKVFDIIKQAAPTEATVLVQGESGTGKELVAHAIHRLSARSKSPLVAVHCAALSSNLLESELFGHEKGAFTNAISRKQGRFEIADGSTLFLDEISEVDSAVQVKLLRVLEERNFERVGGTETINVDIRLIAATNADLKNLVSEKKFREDLFFRLDVVTVTLPPLRDRLEDVPVLCSHFLKEFNKKNDKALKGIAPDAINILSSYTWPGNVRELRNTIEKMVVFARGSKLMLRDIPANIRDAESTKDASASSHGLLQGVGQAGGGDLLADVEKRKILAVLKKNNDNITKASAELGISRRTLHRKLKQYKEEGSS